MKAMQMLSMNSGNAQDGRAAVSRRRRTVYPAIAVTTLAAIAVVAFALASVLGGSTAARPAAADGTYQLPVSAVSAVESVPVSALVGNARAELGTGQVTAPEKLPAAAPKLGAGGRPEVMFVCAEYWAPCAAERWALVMALSKFGAFGNLTGTASSDRESSPSTPTFSFYGAGYSSPYLSLITDELESSVYSPLAREYPLLQFPTKQEMSFISDWDVAPYTSTNGSLPFAYLGGEFLLTSAQYDAGPISKLNFQTAAGLLTSGKSAVSKRLEAAAGYLVADFCALTRDQPASVCSQLPASLVGIAADSQSSAG
jgi:hypothetical protein